MRNNRSKIITILLAASCIVIAVIIGFLLSKSKRNTDSTSAGSSADTSASSAESGETDTDYRHITYQGKKYTYNSSLKTILFLGIDKTGNMISQDYPGYGGQADTILALILNQDDRTLKILGIPRDTMTTIDIYDQNNHWYASETAQITLQYAYGDGASRSCWLMKNTVSRLLLSMPVSASVSLNMDGLDTIIDKIGGVTITMPEDYTYIDPSYVSGASITLGGKEAEAFVRYRDTSVSGSSLPRLERQSVFVKAFLAQLKKDNYSTSQLNQMIDLTGNYMYTDMDAESLKSLFSYTIAGDVITLPGEMTQGETYDEYHVSKDALQSEIIQLFYKEDE